LDERAKTAEPSPLLRVPRNTVIPKSFAGSARRSRVQESLSGELGNSTEVRLRFSIWILLLAGLGAFAAEATGASAQPSAKRHPPPVVSLREIYVEPDVGLAFAYIQTHGLPTGWQFEWGRTKRYGHTTEKPEERAYDGKFPVEVEGLLEPLSPKTTYHFRVIAYNAGGMSVSRDGTFRTPAWKPGCPQKVSCGVIVKP
jgi:hypothetical protein